MPKKTADATTTPAQSDSTKKFDSYQNLKIWQAGMELCRDVYEATEGLMDTTPDLANDMRTSAVNYPASVAQSHGYKFANHYEYARLLRIARHNITRLEVLILVAKDLGLMTEEADTLCQSIHGLTKMTNSFIKIMSRPKPRTENHSGQSQETDPELNSDLVE